MICGACRQVTTLFSVEETSHFGKRPICYACLGKRDAQKMRAKRGIILYCDNGYLVNNTRTLRFKIKQTNVLGDKTELFFSAFKRRWKGLIFNSDYSKRVHCSKLKKEITNG